MKRALFLFSLFLLWPLFEVRPADARDESSDFFVAAQAGRLSGNTTYHINEGSGSTSIDSELEFPLEAAVAGIKMGYTGRDVRGGSTTFAFSWLQSTGSASGVMKDSDWLGSYWDTQEVGSVHPGKDIYSESDSELKARLIDVQAAFKQRIGTSVQLGPVAGYKYQQFKYQCSNVNQVGYGPYSALYTGSVQGLVLTYEVKYNMLYVGASADFHEPFFTATAGLAFSPLVRADDRDDHILRSRLNTATATGYAYLASFGLNWEVFRGRETGVEFGMNGEYLRITTQGTQEQTYYSGSYAGQTASIDDKITSEQLLLTGNLAFHF